MELQDLRDELREKEAEALDHYHRWAVGSDPEGETKWNEARRKAEEVRKRIVEIENAPEPEKPVEIPKPKCHYPPDWGKRKP